MIEAARIERLLQTFLAVQSIPDEKFHDLLSLTVRDIKNSLLAQNCGNCTIYIMNSELSQSVIKHTHIGSKGGLHM